MTTAAELPPCTLYRLRMATRRATRLYDRALAPAGLTIAQFGLMSTIERTGDVTLTELARRLDMERTTLTRNIATLSAIGLVALSGSRDPRAKRVEVTAAGKQALKVAWPLWRAAQGSVREALGDGDLEQLHALLAATLERLPEA